VVVLLLSWGQMPGSSSTAVAAVLTAPGCGSRLWLQQQHPSRSAAPRLLMLPGQGPGPGGASWVAWHECCLVEEEEAEEVAAAQEGLQQQVCVRRSVMAAGGGRQVAVGGVDHVLQRHLVMILLMLMTGCDVMS
jgi:hypothetical protein